MAEIDTTLLVEVLREIRSDIAEMKHDLRRLELRQTVVEGHLTTMVVTLQRLREELDEVRADVRLITKRLELVEQH